MFNIFKKIKRPSWLKMPKRPVWLTFSMLVKKPVFWTFTKLKNVLKGTWNFSKKTSQPRWSALKMGSQFIWKWMKKVANTVWRWFNPPPDTPFNVPHPNLPTVAKWDSGRLKQELENARARVEQAYNKAEHDPYEVFLKPLTWLYWILIILFVSGLSASLYLATVQSSTWMLPVVGCLIFWGVYGFIPIPTEKAAVFYLFGRAVKEVEAGLNFKLPGLMEMQEHGRNILEVEFPGDADNIFWGDEKDDLPDGMVRPIFATTGGKSGKPTAMENPLDRQQTVGVSMSARFFVIPKGLATFFQNIRKMDERERVEMQRYSKTSISAYEAEVIRQLRDTGTRVIREVFGKLTPALIIAHWGDVSDYIRFRLQLSLIKWGVHLEEASLTNQNLSHETNSHIQLVVRSGYERQIAENDAVAIRTRLTGEGLGKAAAAKALETQLGDGLAAQAKALNVKGGEVLAARTAAEIGKNAETILLGGGAVGELIGTVKAASKAIDKGAS